MADDDKLEEELEELEAMFVQVARRMTRDGDRVTLHEVAPATLYFSDRPQRVVGHLTAKQFIDVWDEGVNSFASDPPNAVISFLADTDETPEDAIVVLKDPGLEGDKVSYTVVLLEGNLPKSAESCTVFIDPFGRPLSPVSVAGMNRRARRRARRF